MHAEYHCCDLAAPGWTRKRIVMTGEGRDGRLGFMLAKGLAKRLSKERIDFEVATLVSDFSVLVGLEEMILFGSAASGSMSEASDLDVVLIFDSVENAKQASKIARQKRSSHWPADFVFVSRERFKQMADLGGVLYVAKREGRIIYCHDTHIESV